MRARRSRAMRRSGCGSPTHASGCIRTRIGSQGQLLEFFEEFGDPEPQHRHFSHLFGLHPGPAHHAAHAGALCGGAAIARVARRRRHRLEPRVEGEPLGAAARWRPRVCHAGEPAAAGGHIGNELHRRRRRVRQPVRCAPAVPDRRQLRRDRRDRRDAGAEPRRRDSPAAGAAVGVARQDG